jgi:type II secretory pathway component PulM
VLIGACSKYNHPMQYPIPALRTAAQRAIPGCHFAHGEKEEENIHLDKLKFSETVVLVEPKMLVVPSRNKYKVRTTTTFQATVSVLAYAKLTDEAEARLERMNRLLTAAMALLSALEQDASLQEIVARNIVSSYNQFDANLDGVVMQLDITPAERASLC